MATTVRTATHERVAQALRERIRTGGWQTGQMLPGRRRLALEHGVALATVDRAVTTLISEGVLRADDRRGTFVAAGAATFGAPCLPPAAGRPPAQPLVATVGLVATIFPRRHPDDYQEQWPFHILEGCEHRLASEPGLTIRFVNLHDDGDGHRLDAAELGDKLLAERLDAAIFIEHTPSPAELASLAGGGRPVVLARLDPLATDLPQIYIDNLAGGAMAARHLLERGYQRLLFFQPFVAPWTKERLAGIRAGLATLGRPPEQLVIMPPAPRPINGLEQRQRATGHAAALALFDSGWQAGTGVVAPNDWVAQGFMDAAAARGLIAGRDYGLVGFDDRTRESNLTSLRPPLAGLGEAAADIVLARLRGDNAPSRIALRHRLIARSSSQAPETPSPNHPPALRSV